MMLRLLLVLMLTLAPVQAGASDVVVDEDAEEAFFRGVSLLQAEAYAEALIEFESALNLQPDLRRVHYYKALAHLRVGDYALARAAGAQYARFPLDEGEARQLEELRGELELLDPGGASLPVEAAEEEEDEPDDAGPRVDAEDALGEAERALEQGDCATAVNLSDQALRLDPRASRAFVVKGRALLCIGEAERARSILLAFMELHAGRDPATDGEAEALLTQVEAKIAASTVPREGPVAGNDPAIKVAFGVLLAPNRAALEKRSERELIPGVGVARSRRSRFQLAGSRAEGTRAWVSKKGRLRWVRVRVWGRRGPESPSWFEAAFKELWAEIADDAGPPDEHAGVDANGNGDAAAALAGFVAQQARWEDADGDTWSLRLGRCTVPGSRGRSIVENRPCLELLGHLGNWKPGRTDEVETAAAWRSEVPGVRRPDFSLGVLWAAPSPTAWHERGQTPGIGYAPGPGFAMGGGILARFAFEGLAWGVAWEFSAAIAATLSSPAPVFFENRLMGYIGGRLGPRQPTTVDLFFGGGFSPEAGGVFPSLGVRIVGTSRTDRVGRFVFSIEPHVIVSDTYVTIVPVRISFGGAVGLLPRPIQ